MSKKSVNQSIKNLILGSMILLSLVVDGIIYFCFPEYFTVYILLIPVYFFVLAFSLLFAISRICTQETNVNKAWSKLLTFNMFQLLISVILLFIYIKFIDQQRPAVLLVFSFFYAWFLGLKTYSLYQINLYYKQLKEAENEK